jgi:hypothetical protein
VWHVYFMFTGTWECRTDWKNKGTAEPFEDGMQVVVVVVVVVVIQFNSILYYLCAESTATRPITDTAQYRYT